MVRGIKFREYRCQKDEDLAMIAAQQYYVDFSTDMNRDRVLSLIPQYIPDNKLTGVCISRSFTYPHFSSAHLSL